MSLAPFKDIVSLLPSSFTIEGILSCLTNLAEHSSSGAIDVMAGFSVNQFPEAWQRQTATEYSSEQVAQRLVNSLIVDRLSAKVSDHSEPSLSAAMSKINSRHLSGLVTTRSEVQGISKDHRLRELISQIHDWADSLPGKPGTTIVDRANEYKDLPAVELDTYVDEYVKLACCLRKYVDPGRKGVAVLPTRVYVLERSAAAVRYTAQDAWSQGPQSSKLIKWCGPLRQWRN